MEVAEQPNQLGARGQPISYTDDEMVVLLVGDSQVEWPFGSLKEMPEALLQHELVAKFGRSVKVFSLAASGWGQDQQLIALGEYFKRYRADLVVVWATPGNDFWENTFSDRNGTSDAGPIKPTFLDEKHKLSGPFYASAFYLGGSALAQLVLTALRGATPNEILLAEWKRRLPSAAVPDQKVLCQGTIEIDQSEYFANIYSIDHRRNYTLKTAEDITNGRTHFSPLTKPESPLNAYQRDITRILFDRLRQTAYENGAAFKVFYPMRSDFDELSKSIVCVRNSDGRYWRYAPDFAQLLRQVVQEPFLLLTPIEGADENVVSKTDRHLGLLGNRKAMRSLSSLLEIPTR